MMPEKEEVRLTVGVKQKSRYTILECVGSLDSYSGTTFIDEVKNLSLSDGGIIVRCRKLESLAPSGVGVLLRMIEDFRSTHQVVFTELNSTMQKTLDDLGVTDSFVQFPRLGAAKRHLRKLS